MHLIPFTTDHFTTLASWFNSEEDVVLWGGPFLHFPLDTAQMQAILDECNTNPPRRKCWMVEENDQIIGHIELGFDWRNDNAILQRVEINPAFRGRGLAEPMVRLAVADAFSNPRVARLELNVFSFNEPAIKTYKKVGFVTEGTRRSSTRVGSQRWDGTVMALLPDEYKSLQTK
jgi:RimJ/RimL family protein N-acetyltransferase